MVGINMGNTEDYPSFVTFNLPLLFITTGYEVCETTLNIPISYIIGKEGHLPLSNTPPYLQVPTL
jgi:hypothetical protein